MKIDTSIEALKDTCLDWLSTVKSDMLQLQSDRADSLNAYLSRPYGNELEGRSQFVTSDVSDVVESILPSLLKTFYGSSTVVSLQPVGPEDSKAAKLLEQKVNYDFTTGINGYQVYDTWFRDALLQKIGVVKYYWLEEEKHKFVEYEDLTEPEYINLLQKADTGELIIDKEEAKTSQEAIYDEFGMVASPAVTSYEIEGRKVQKICKPMVVNVPPEEFIFPMTAKSIDDATIIAHKKRVHKTYLAKYKVTEDDITSECESLKTDPLYIARFSDLGGVWFVMDENDNDFVYIYECYLNQYDKKGKVTPMKLVILGNKVIDAEENKYGRPPFCVLTPYPIPHRMIGRDVADMVKPIQELSTFYTRFTNDNLAYQNLGMRVVNPFRMQMEDLLNENKPGGIIRTKYDVDPSRCMMPVTPTPLSPEVYGLMEKIDMMRQERTGVTKYQSGMDSKSLNRTATGIAQIMGAAQQRIELIARGFAETGVRQLFQALVDLNLDFLETETNIRINKEWAVIRPEDIDGKFDITVDVSSSFGSAEIKSQQMLTALNTYMMLKQGGTPIVDKYIYAVLNEWWNVQGYKDTSQYAPQPETATQDIAEDMQDKAQLANLQQQLMPQPTPQGTPPGGMPQ